MARPSLAILVAVVVGVAMAQEPCLTPDNLSGQCIDIADCSYLNELLKNTNRTTEETKRLTKSQCGQKGRHPKVCCSAQTITSVTSCITPNHLPGTCVNIYDCPAFYQMISFSKILTNQTREYLILSNCTGPAKYNVCCKYPKAPTKTEDESDIILNPDTLITDEPKKKVEIRFSEDLLPSECGSLGSSDRIIGGEETAIDDYPWMVLIEYKSRMNTIDLSCAGSLITAKYVLTAAHCVYGNIYATAGIPANVRLGEYNKSTGQDCVPVAGGGYDCNDEPVIIPVENIIIHESYNPQIKHTHDIALIRMTKEAPTSYFISPICLPTTDTLLNTPDDGKNLTVAGWGRTEKAFSSEVKLKIDVPYKTLATCKLLYGNVTQLEDTQMCAGGTIGQDSCKGDSGGPLMEVVDQKIYLVGVVSIGMKPCAAAGKPGIYTKVIRYRDWILSNMKP